jgi:hypothetical protein
MMKTQKQRCREQATWSEVTRLSNPRLMQLTEQRGANAGSCLDLAKSWRPMLFAAIARGERAAARRGVQVNVGGKQVP